jgi:cytochrome c-type biogenesis protein CcmH
MRGARQRWGGRISSIAILGVCFLAAASPGRAVMPDEILADARLEVRARAISAGLRCLVCQNQSIDDSEAPLARDLRLLVRERLVGGDSDAEVRAFIVARYGDFVLLKPPLTWGTLLLWLAPFAILLGAAGVVARAALRRRSEGAGRARPAPALTPEEEARLKALLATTQGATGAREER